MPRVSTENKLGASVYFSLIASVISLFLILGGAVGLLLIQKPLLEGTADIRGNASVGDGKVQLFSSYQTNTGNGDHYLTINANTNGANVQQFELVFNLITNTFSEAPRVVLLGDTNLQLTKTEIEQTEDGFLLSVIAAPLRTGNTFVSTSEKGLIQLQFYPTREGSLSLSLDNEKSKANIGGGGAGQDQLRVFPTNTYTITRSTAAASYKQCNQECTSNSQCAPNFRCFENRCRLATHPSSTTCSVPADNGLQRRCNEYCADTRECASGYSCFYNRCRLPDNPDSATCAQTTASLQQTITQNCNKSCGSNADCANNMRCFQGVCRLATNPSSTSCTATNRKPVSSQYYPTVTNPSKGQAGPADVPNTPLPTATPKLVPTPTATARPATSSGTSTATKSAGVITPSPSPFIVVSPSPAVRQEPVITPLPADQPVTGFDLSRLFGESLSLPLIALVAGIGLLLLVILLTLMNVLRRRGGPVAGPNPANQKTQAYEADLQKKIDSLRQQPASPASPMPIKAAATNPVNPVKPFNPPTPVAAPTVVTARPTSQTPSSPTTFTSQTQPTTSPIMARNTQSTTPHTAPAVVTPAPTVTTPRPAAPTSSSISTASLPNKPASQTSQSAQPITSNRPIQSMSVNQPTAKLPALQNIRPVTPVSPPRPTQPLSTAPSTTNAPVSPAVALPKAAPTSSMMGRLKQKGVNIPSKS